MTTKSSNKKTEIHMEFLGTAAINPFVANNSSSRMVMDSSHFRQTVPLVYPDEITIKTGMCYELGKYIDDVRVEDDSVVRGAVSKYREMNLEHPPEYALLTEIERHGEPFLDIIEMPMYKASHGFFGYQLEPTQEFSDIGHASVLAKDTILAKTTSLSDSGAYKFGVSANTVFMSHPSVAEDGFVVSQSFLDKTQFTSITTRIIDLDKKCMPLNLYGKTGEFKFIPDIGEKVRPDGLLCATRERYDWLSVSDLNDANISEPDYTFDLLTYVNVDSTVIDIEVIKGEHFKPEYPESMRVQLDKYYDMFINYCRNVVNSYENILKEKRAMYGKDDAIRLTPRLHRFLTEAKVHLSLADGGRNKLSYRRQQIDQYRVKVTTMSVVRPSHGFKITDIHASKGVNCHVLPDEFMPVDENGVRADVIADNTSTISRMNLGRAYESYLGACSRDNRTRLINYFVPKYGQSVEAVDDADLEYFRNYVTGMYELINPDMVEFLNGLDSDGLRAHLHSVLFEDLYLYFPPDNAINIVDVIRRLEETPYKPHLGKVSYMDDLGNYVTTDENIRMGKLYFLVLEKIANDYSAVSSSRVNNFGFPIRTNNRIDKFKYPHSLAPTKTLGETEVRIITSYTPPETIAELVDQNLSLTTHKQIIKQILESGTAFDGNLHLDRTANPYGNSKSLAVLKHMFNASGFDFTKSND
ncbi:putative RNA polymerase subunit beta [Bacillus phage vB_BspM_AgentSmith]|nr:putative RNA polymerase subunit beta [Bacillus phage vB_BspM_AgentSmith]